MSDSFVAPWTITHQAPLSMGFPRQECWYGLPFPSPGDLSNLGIKPMSLALAGVLFFFVLFCFFTTEPPAKSLVIIVTSMEFKRHSLRMYIFENPPINSRV